MKSELQLFGNVPYLLQAGTEILVWYGREYGKELGIIREDEEHIKRHVSADQYGWSS